MNYCFYIKHYILKITYTTIICAVVIAIFIDGCSKASNSSTTTCTTCTIQCYNAIVTANGYGIVDNEGFCGGATTVQVWKDSLATVYPSNNYTIAYTNQGSSKKLCGTSGQIADTTVQYTAAGYTCQ